MKTRTITTTVLAGVIAATPLIGVTAVSAAPTPPKKVTKATVKLPWSVTQAHVKKYKLSTKQIKTISKSVAWARKGKAKTVRYRESKHNYKIRSRNGKYHGAYQYLASTWRNIGGGKYAKRADLAPAWAQDHITYQVVKKYGWSPWGG